MDPAILDPDRPMTPDETEVGDDAPAEANFPPKLAPLFLPMRYKVLYGGRGGAKSWGIARALLLLGMMRPLRILCARETMQSINESVHRLLADQIKNMGLHANDCTNGYMVEKSRIFNTIGTEFTFAGLRHNVHNIKSLEGSDIVWIEEAANVSADSWDTLIPTIRKPGSEIWISFNPVLETDATYTKFVVDPPTASTVINIGWRDNPWFPEVLEIERVELLRKDPVTYAHVWEGACKSSVEGAVYSGEIMEAEQEGRICQVPYDRTKPVHTIWDLGHADATAIWFVQQVGPWYHFIDYLEDRGKTIAEYLVRLQNKSYIYATDWLPHDGVDAIIHHKLTGDRSMSVEQLLRQSGRKVRVIPKLHVVTGINAARTIFPLCRFDKKKCETGLRALRMYQWGPIPASGVRRREPLHDDASHGADAFRGVPLALKPQAAVDALDVPKPKPANNWGGQGSGGYTPFA